MMTNAKRSKKLVVQVLIFPTLVGLNIFDFSVKEELYMGLEGEENVLHISSINHKINPREFFKVINKTNVIFIATNRYRGRTRDIRMNEFKRHSRMMDRVSIW
jgi:hypothetical protein